jgi:hypothetical protein
VSKRGAAISKVGGTRSAKTMDYRKRWAGNYLHGFDEGFADIFARQQYHKDMSAMQVSALYVEAEDAMHDMFMNSISVPMPKYADAAADYVQERMIQDMND